MLPREDAFLSNHQQYFNLSGQNKPTLLPQVLICLGY